MFTHRRRGPPFPLFHLIGFGLAASLAALTGCAGPPATYAPVNAAFVATLQNDQYLRDAQATGTARAVQFLADAQNVQATAEQATRAALNVQATLDVYATRAEQERLAQITATAVAYLQATETAQARATATAIAYAQSTEAAQVHATATSVAELKATQARAVEATQTAIVLQAQLTQVERDKAAAVTAWVLLFASLLGALALLAWLAVVGIQAWRKRLAVITHGPFGSPLLILDGAGGKQIIVDPARLFGPAAVVERDGNIVSPALAQTWMQERATQRAQLIALQQANHNPFPPPSAAERRVWRKVGPVEWESQTVSGGLPVLQPASAHTPEPNDTVQRAAETLLSEAPWRLLDDWPGGGLPLGLSTSGLLLADPEQAPHLLIAGSSGSGKTRYGLRPLITAALADGWQTLIFDRSGLDFLPFREHPNATLMVLRDPADAVGYLAALHDEMERRFALLRDSGASTWSRLAIPHQNEAPRLLCVFDEFSNLADSLNETDRVELWRWARMLAAEGRKAGVHLALALQDPTHKSLDLRIRRNCTPLAFRVKDGEASRVVLGAGGAEALAPRQFMAVIGGLTRGVAFAPEDEQIADFLTRRRVATHPHPDWLQLPPTAEERPTVIVQQIRQLRSEGHSLNSIQQQVFGYTGGKAYSVVRAALRNG